MFWFLLILTLVVYFLLKHSRKNTGLTNADLIDPNERVYKFDVKGLQIASYRTHLSNCQVGDEVELLAEPTNSYDSNAIKVICNKQLIGYVPKEKTKNVSKICLGENYAQIAHIYQNETFAECFVAIYFKNNS
ncbi:MAG: HIRAN domain-containing protein [Ginsengibacter sp.]